MIARAAASIPINSFVLQGVVIIQNFPRRLSPHDLPRATQYRGPADYCNGTRPKGFTETQQGPHPRGAFELRNARAGGRCGRTVRPVEMPGPRQSPYCLRLR